MRFSTDIIYKECSNPPKLWSLSQKRTLICLKINKFSALLQTNAIPRHLDCWMVECWDGISFRGIPEQKRCFRLFFYSLVLCEIMNSSRIRLTVNNSFKSNFFEKSRNSSIDFLHNHFTAEHYKFNKRYHLQWKRPENYTKLKGENPKTFE